MSLFNRVGNLISGQILSARNHDDDEENPKATPEQNRTPNPEVTVSTAETSAFDAEFGSALGESDPFLESAPIIENDFAARRGAMGLDVVADVAPIATAPIATAPIATAPIATAPIATAPIATALAETALAETVAIETVPIAPPATALMKAAPAGIAAVGAVLEEWSEPLPQDELLDALPDGTIVDAPDGSWRIEKLLSQQTALNLYRAVNTSDAEERAVNLRQAQGERAERLRREAQLRQEVASPMLPRVLTTFERDEGTFCVEEIPVAEMTLAQLLQTAPEWSELLHILTQVAAALVRLHAAGWSHGALRPEIIALSRPIQITDLSFALPFGQTPTSVQAPAGYAAPESFARPPAAPSLDIYAVGALLYRALSGAPLPESGADLRAWKPQLLVAGAPQILARCLGAPESRYQSMEALHRDLLRLKNGLQPHLRAEIAGASSVGLEPSRVTNQDAWGQLSGAWQSDGGAQNWSVACVADGMGGMAAGEIASEIAVNTLLECAHHYGRTLQKEAAPNAAEQGDALKDWTRQANARVCAAMEERGVRGGCTLVAVSVLGERLCLAHIGDCRCYLWRNGEYQLLSRDHSFVMSLVLQGEISLDEVRTHADRSKITRSLGDRHPLPDYFVDGLDVVTGKTVLELQADDVILLCSDGLWEPVEESAMATALKNGSLQGAAQSLIESALRAGAPDNATVVLVRMNETRESAVQVLAGA